jgi:hypothetical protein
MQMRSRFAVLFVSLFVISLPGSSQPKPNNAQTTASSQPEQAHGTVNIFLAAGGNLVAVTDSMLTFSSTDHRPEGLKLYKLDERTICAMAGLYSDPAPLESLVLSVPEIIRNISQQWVRLDSSHVQFAILAAGAFESFRLQLTSHLQAAFAANPALKIDRLAVELTLAGYDNDGTLKLAELSLVPRRTQSGVTFVTIDRPHSNHLPTCSLVVAGQRTSLRRDEGDNFFVMFDVGNRFFCDVAGKQEVAEALLDNPNYAQDLKDPEKVPSAIELRKTAIDLERQTAENETRNKTFEVGGDVEVAGLSDGKIVEDPPPLKAPDVGGSLVASHYDGAHIRCNPGSPAISVSGSGSAPAAINTSPFSQFQADVNGCTQVLDQLIFHDSTFTDSTLIYMGSSGLIFADSNQIIRSTLLLAPQVNLGDSTVEHLVCSFPWDAVYQNSKPVTLTCPKKGNVAGTGGSSPSS